MIANQPEICDTNQTAYRSGVPDRDTNDKPDIKEAVRQVNEITDSDPVNGEELLESEDLKRQLREAKERLSSKPSGK